MYSNHCNKKINKFLIRGNNNIFLDEKIILSQPQQCTFLSVQHFPYHNHSSIVALKDVWNIVHANDLLIVNVSSTNPLISETSISVYICICI